MLSLKARNEPHLISAMILNGILIYAFLDNSVFSSSGFLSKFESWQEAGMFATLFALLTNIATHLLKREYKDFFVYLIWPAAPGHRVFSEYVKHDSRIDLERIQDEASYEISQEMDSISQNKIWYRLYKRVSDQPEIIQSHGKWLLFRDLNILVLMFTIIFIIIAVFGKTNNEGWNYFYILIIELVIVNISARNVGIAFVCNVLALSSVAKND